MTILVAVASRHGSTRQIAEVIAEELRGCGHEAEVRDADEVHDLAAYQAVVVGSAVYMGGWLPAAKQFVARHDARLAAIPVWYFSSGPLGLEDPKPHGDPPEMGELIKVTGAKGHRVFVGKLDKRQLGVGERLIASVVRAPDGDFRDWEAIHEWGREIAGALRPELVAR